MFKTEKKKKAPATVAHLVEYHPAKGRVADLIPCQGTHLRCGFSPPGCV